MELILIAMPIFAAIFENDILWACILSWLVAQTLKILINLVVHRKFVPERLWGDGGMPSGHSATVAALAASCGWYYGFDSVVFAITAILMIIVTHDATGVRREAGKHAVSIKLIAEVINNMVENKDEEIKTEKIKELVGHTPLQVFFGILVGVIVTVIFCAVKGIPYCGLTDNPVIFSRP